MFPMSLTPKKEDYIFEEPLNLHVIVFLTFLLFRCGFQEKIEPSRRNYLIWTADWGGVQNTPNRQNGLIIFLSAIALMQVISWTEDDFYFISDCRNSFNNKLKKLIKEQIIIFYSPSNALSSDEFVQIKHFRYHTLIGVCSLSTWLNLKILNFY